MGSFCLPLGFIFTACVCVHVSKGDTVATSPIDCNASGNVKLQPRNENYFGPLETFTDIPPGTTVELTDHIYPEHLRFLELNFTVGDTVATVLTKVELDAEAVDNGELFFAVRCVGSDVQKTRTLKINDINDNPPIFQQKEYQKTVSEVLAVGSSILKVEAKDADVSTTNSIVTYLILSPAEDHFEIKRDGSINLKKVLNYSAKSHYTFSVEARDVGGLTDTAMVDIVVTDFDNLNPYFSHSLYQAIIQENQVRPLNDIKPEPVKAQDGDTGLNVAVVYSISEVSPIKYSSHFSIDETSGLVTVVEPLDREEIASLLLHIKAAQVDDSQKTADSLVSVTVEDVNDSLPQFDQTSYFATLPENSPEGSFLLKVAVTDKDEGGFNGTLRVIPETVPFTLGDDGTLRVKDSSVLDRENTRSFTFQIKAEEKASPFNTVSADVNVTLLDVNDNNPKFDSSSYQAKVFRNQTVDMVVVKVTAEDLDEGPNAFVTYAIEGGNEDNYFSMNTDTGEILLKKEIPFKENEIFRFSLYVTATDEGTPPRSSLVAVDIMAPGESKPHFLRPVYQGRAQEEVEPPVQVVKVDFMSVVPEGEIHLEVNSNMFSIDQNGNVFTLSRLDYETERNYSLVVSLRDGSNHDETSVIVEVTDINDNPPVFTPDFVSTTLREDATVGFNVTQKMEATDDDDGFNGKIFYSLQGGDGKFNIDPQSGRIFLVGLLDREAQDEIVLEVVAHDQGQPPQSASSRVVVTVEDVNDNAPQFSATEYQVQVSEHASVNTTILTLAAVDLDEGSNALVTYRIEQQSPPTNQPIFLVEPDSGVLQLVHPLDFETDKEYKLSIEASDGGVPRLNGTCTVSVRVLDENDNEPQFEKEKYDVSVYENLPGGAALISLQVTDKDEAGFVNGHFILDSKTFGINKQGTVFLNSNASLDREKQDSYILQVVAVDSPINGLSGTAQINITVLDINDNPPVFKDNVNNVTVREDAEVGVNVIEMVASDNDAGLNGKVSYFLEGHGKFSIDPQSGKIVVAGQLDREAQDEIVLEVVARDQGQPPQSASSRVVVTVEDVNDNAPQFPATEYQVQVSEHASVNTTILTLAAVDLDEGSNALVTYRIEQQSPPTNQPIFLVEPDSGVLQLVHPLDFETDKEYKLSIEASDGGVPRLNGTCTVSVRVLDENDNEPQFEKEKYDVSVYENLPGGAALISLQVTDKDEAGFVNGHFILDSKTFGINKQGTVFLNSNASLDREKQDSYILQVVAVDSPINGLSGTAQINITVLDTNDNPPVFKDNVNNVTVREDAEVGVNVIEMVASDNDAGLNGKVSYFLEGHGKFSIDPQSGKIVVAGQLDREAQDEIVLEVVARDQGQPPQSASSRVVVTVEDVNDNAPQFSATEYQVQVSEHASVNTTILTLAAVDLDEGSNALVTYRIKQQSPPTNQPIFLVEPDSGVLQLVHPLDFETDKEYKLSIEASDGGVPRLNGTCTVSVRVLDENDNEPQFEKEKYDVSVYENLPGGAALISLQVTDKDEAGFTNGHFILESESFGVNKQGTVFLNSNTTLDREKQNNYVLQVVAIDSPENGLSGTAQINVTILDINDNNPEFLPLPNNNRIPEGNYSLTHPKKVCQINTADPDQGDNGRVTLSILSSDPKMPFQIREDGTVVAVAPIDRETKDVYEVVIVASDNGTPQRKNLTDIRIDILDENDNDPEFSQDIYTKNVLLTSSGVGDVVLTLSATDKDIGNNSDIVYSFLEENPLLALDSKTGVITLTSSVEKITESTILNLTAQAHDKGKPPRSSTASVQALLWVSTPALAFEEDMYNFSVAEKELEGTVVGEVRAWSGSDVVQVDYVLRTHTDLFSVDERGVIQTLRTLDREAQERYTMPVEAVDSRTPPNTAFTMVTVEVKDVNEAPVFSERSYSAKIFSIVPYKHPVVRVKATDPDSDENGKVEYSLLKSSSLFDVDPVTGQVYVVSLQGQTGLLTMSVKATDPQGLFDTTGVEVTVMESNDQDIVVVSINHPANTVERKRLEFEQAMGRALDMMVTVTSIFTASSMKVRSSRSTEETFVGFIAMSSGQTIVPFEKVVRELESRREKVKEELEMVFGAGLEMTVGQPERESDSSDSTQGVVIALGVLLGLSIVALVVLVVLTIRFVKQKKNLDFNNPYMRHKNSESREIENTEKHPTSISRLENLQEGEMHRRSTESGMNSEDGSDSSRTSAF